MERNRMGTIVKLTSCVTHPPLYLHFCWWELQFPDYKRWPGVTSAQGTKGWCTSWMRCRLEQQMGGGWLRQVSASPQPESLRISQVLLRKLSKFKDSYHGPSVQWKISNCLGLQSSCLPDETLSGTCNQSWCLGPTSMPGMRCIQRHPSHWTFAEWHEQLWKSQSKWLEQTCT